MGTNAAGRALRFEPPFDGLTLVSFVATESVSSLSEYVVGAEIVDPAAFDFTALVGQIVKVMWEPQDVSGGPSRCFQGVVAGVVDVEVHLDAPPKVLLRVRPWLWLLTFNVQCRIYQSATLTTVIEDVIANLKAKAGLTFLYDVAKIGNRPSRNYCVQYNESDYAFLSRLLEDEGVYYFYDADGTLCFADNSKNSVPAARHPFEPTVNPSAGPIVSWIREQNLHCGAFVVRDFNFQAPERTFANSHALPASIDINGSTVRLPSAAQLKCSQAPAGYAHFVDVIGSGSTGARDGQSADPTTALQSLTQDRSTIRAEEQAAQSFRVRGRGSFAHFFAGCSFRPKNSLLESLGDYFLLSVTHEIQAPSTRSGAESEFVYKCSFECLPQTLAYRPPPTTPKPRIQGTQTARVVGPPGPEVHTDVRGRILVEFNWSKSDPRITDLGTHFEASTCSAWVRVAQASAGKGWGTQMIPRIGQEVVVGFENGDPDMPIVLGCVYNTTQTPAFPVPQFNLSSGIKTHTPDGNADDFNGIRFDDLAERELAHFRANRYMLIDAKDTIVMGAADRFHRFVGKTDVHIVGGGLFPFTRPNYKPMTNFVGSYPPNWQPLEINEGNMFTTNSVAASFGNNTVMDVMYRLNTSSTRHDISCACVSPLTIATTISKGLLVALSPAWKGFFRSCGQGMGRLDFNVGPAAEITCGSSLAIHRGGHYELALSDSWTPAIPGLGEVLKIGWYLYTITAGVIPSMTIGANPDHAEAVSKACAFITRGLGFILLNIEHALASVHAGKEVAQAAALLIREAAQQLTVGHMNAPQTARSGLSGVKASLAALGQDLDVGNQFMMATGGYYTHAKKDVTLVSDVGVAISGGNSVYLKGKAISMRTEDSCMLIGDANSPFHFASNHGAFALSFTRLSPKNFILRCGAAKIEIDLAGCITIEGLRIALKTLGGAAINLGPAQINSTSPIISTSALAQHRVDAPAQAHGM